MGRLKNSYSKNLYKYKLTIYENEEKNKINEIKLFSSLKEMERNYNVSSRTLSKYLDSNKKQQKIKNISISKIEPTNRYNNKEINYDIDELKNL